MTDVATSNCPTLDRLEALVAGDVEDSSLEQHVGTCLHCRARTMEIRENAKLLKRIRRWQEESRTNSFGDHHPDARTLPSLTDYEIIAPLDRGGQGAIYLAVQRSTNREVALKFLLAGAYATTRQRARFDREVEIVAGLTHPGIVTVHEAGTAADDRVFLAMELVDGVPLDEWCAEVRAQGYPARETRRHLVELFVAVADAIGYAHQRGLMHRDLKPSNILVDSEGRPHILDFGLARPVILPAGEELHHRTVEGSFVGTLAYASPEQTRGRSDDVDVRTDVYAIGAMLYQALTGLAAIDLSDDLADAINAIREIEPVAPRRRVPGCSDDELDAIVMTSLAKSADDRYGSALSLRDDLVRYSKNEPIIAKRHRGGYLVRKMIERHRMTAAIAGGFVVVLVVTGIALASAWREARDEAQKVRQINIFLEDTLASARSRDGRSDVTVKDMLDEAVHWVDLALADQPESAASIRSAIANGFRNIGLYEEAKVQAALSLALREKLFGAAHPEVAASLNLLGLVHRDAGDLGSAQRLIERSLSMRDALLDEHDDRIAISHSNLASVLFKAGANADAWSHYERALAIRRANHLEDHPDVAMTLFQLAVVAEQSAGGDLLPAENLHREALRIRAATLSALHPDLLRSRVALASLLANDDRPVEALELVRPALQTAIDSMGANHIGVIEVRELLAECLESTGAMAAAYEQWLLVEAFYRSTRDASDERLRHAEDAARRTSSTRSGPAGSDGG